MKAHRGFTLVELITTMIVLAILAAFAIPKFNGSHGFESRGFSDQLRSLIQEGRRTAVAQRRLVCVNVGGGAVSVRKATLAGGACDTNLLNPNSNGPYQLPIPVGINLIGGGLNFDPLGRLSPTTAVDLTISGAEGNFSLRVEGETGYVH